MEKSVSVSLIYIALWAEAILNNVDNSQKKSFDCDVWREVKGARAKENMLLLYKETRRISRAQKLISDVYAIIFFKATFEIFGL